MLASFQKAIDTCEDYLTVALHSRGNMAAQYDLLASAYLAYRDGHRKENRTIYKEIISERLGGRDSTTPENKRPFLLLLHALFEENLKEKHSPTETRFAATIQRRVSKMTTALEKIADKFKILPTPSVEDVVDFIQSSGGIEGLWAKANPVNKTGFRKHSSVRYKLANIDGRIVKTTDGKGHALHLNLDPGEYLIRVQVYPSGRVKVKRTARS